MEASSSQDVKETTVAPKVNLATTIQLEAHVEVEVHDEDISEEIPDPFSDDEDDIIPEIIPDSFLGQPLAMVTSITSLVNVEIEDDEDEDGEEEKKDDGLTPIFVPSLNYLAQVSHLPPTSICNSLAALSCYWYFV